MEEKEIVEQWWESLEHQQPTIEQYNNINKKKMNINKKIIKNYKEH